MRTTKKLPFVLGVCLVVGLMLAPQLLAQNPTGTLVGNVTDSDGGSMPGVTVSVSSPSLQGTRTAQTGVNGAYKLAFLPAGDYQVTFELEGFATVVSNVRIFAAQPRTADATMEISEVYEEIVVTGNVEAISETTQIASTLSHDELEKLPVARNIGQAAQLAPGVHATGPGNNITISGAMSFENLWLVNGVVINENLRGQALPLYIEDAVQETTTATGGISAEYGRFTGGVINVLTKSGGNEFSGSLRLNLANDDWQSQTPLSGDRVNEINRTYEATLGGPFWKDKLWFFAAGRDVANEGTNQTNITTITYPTSNEQQRFEGKLTVSLTSSHSLIGSYIKIDQASTNSAFGQYLDLASLTSRTDPQEIKSGNYTGILTPNFFVEAQYSERLYSIAQGAGGPRDLVAGTLMRNRGTNFRYHAPTFCGECEDEQRDNENLLAKASYFLTTEGAGTHDIIFGYDTFEDIRFAINHQTGSDFTVWSSDLIIDDGNNIFPQFTGDSTWIGWWAVFNEDIAQPTSFKTNSFYVNDSWQLNEHWSFNLGLRYDENDGDNSAGFKVVDDAKTSPRMGLTWDTKGDGDLVFNASFGTYVAAIANNQADSTTQGGAIGLYLMRYGGPLVNVDEGCEATGTCTTTTDALGILWDWYFANGGTTDDPDNVTDLPGLFYTSIPGVTSVIPSTLKSPATDEITVGVVKRLGNKGLLRADIVYRDGTDFYSNLRSSETGFVETSLGDVDVTHVGNYGNDILSRTYKGVNLQARYRFTDRLSVSGNYTWSQLKGNINGETGVSGPIAESPNDYPEYQDTAWSFPKGYLAADQRHKLRAWMTYDIFDTEHHSLNFAILESYWSGTPYSAVGAVSTVDIVGDLGYVNVQGDPFGYFFSERGAFKTDDITRTDISLNYAFRWNLWGKSMEVFIQPEMLNVFNEDGVVDVNNDVFDATTDDDTYAAFNPFTETPIEGVHWAKSENFGQPQNENDYQLPRVYRLSIGFRF
ncbi:MAG: TonB-dependent receptor [bacterium]|nr:TonB-dependent receptor [bacterium]